MVRDVVRNSNKLDGKVIRVVGIVYRCQQLGCDLLDAKKPAEFGFGLGTNPGFDEEVRLNLRKKIIVEGQVDATCLHQGERSLPTGQTEMIICTDRASVLKNPKLVESR